MAHFLQSKTYQFSVKVAPNSFNHRKISPPHNWNCHPWQFHCKRSQANSPPSIWCAGSLRGISVNGKMMLMIAFYLGIITRQHPFESDEWNGKYIYTRLTYDEDHDGEEEKPVGWNHPLRSCCSVYLLVVPGPITLVNMVYPEVAAWCLCRRQKRHPMTLIIAVSQRDWLKLWFVHSLRLEIRKTSVVHLTHFVVDPSMWSFRVERNNAVWITRCLNRNQIAVQK